MKEIVLVIPCFNEEDRLDSSYFKKLLLEFNSIVDIKKYKLILLFVNDGSTDQTVQKVKDINLEDNVWITNLPFNVGKANAIRAGFLRALESKVEYVATLDADGAFSNTEVARKLMQVIEMREKEETFDLVSFARIRIAGSSIDRKSSRHIIGRIVSGLMNLGVSQKIYDFQSGFKIYSGNLLQQNIFMNSFKTRWFMEWELVNRSQEKIIIIEIPIKLWKDVGGSKIKLSNAYAIIREIFYVKKIQFQNGVN